MQRLQPFVHREQVGDRSGRRQQPGVADRQRDFEQCRIRAKPIGPGAAMGEIRPELFAQIGAGNHADVDFIPELGQYSCGSAADAIAARFVYARLDPDVFGDDGGQVSELFALEVSRQVAGIRVSVGRRLDKRRVVPGLQMSANFARPRLVQVADELVAFGRAADRVIEDKGRSHPIACEDRLGLGLALDRAHAAGAARRLTRPVELGFGVDDDDDHRRVVDGPVDHPPCFRVEHASAMAIGSARHSHRKPSFTWPPRAAIGCRNVFESLGPHLSNRFVVS